MTLRSSTRIVADRLGNAIKRITVESTDEAHQFRELLVSLFNKEKQKEIEHFEPYGFTSRVQPPSSSGGQLKKPEGVMVFAGGNRSHGMVIVVGDRRYRLQTLAQGEVAMYDDQGQKIHITRAGINIDGGSSKLPVTVTVGNATARVADGEIKTKVDDIAVYVSEGRIDLGKKGAPHNVVTIDGPSKRVFAVINETDD